MIYAGLFNSNNIEDNKTEEKKNHFARTKKREKGKIVYN